MGMNTLLTSDNIEEFEEVYEAASPYSLVAVDRGQKDYNFWVFKVNNERMAWFSSDKGSKPPYTRTPSDQFTTDPVDVFDWLKAGYQIYFEPVEQIPEEMLWE